jgi:hypothetical protein
MKKTLCCFIGMSIIALAPPALGQSEDPKEEGAWSGLSIRVSFSQPELAKTIHTTGTNGPGSQPIKIDGETISRGENPRIPSIGISRLSKKYSGFSTRLGYEFRRESKMKYTTAEIEGFEGIRPEIEGFELEKTPPPWPYSLHRFAISWPWYIRVMPEVFDIYLGGGASFCVIAHPKATGISVEEQKDQKGDSSVDDRIEFGFTGFPLVGCEYYLTRTLSASLEYQQHYGRTFDEKNSQGSVTNTWHVSLSGPHLEASLNLYW